MRLLPLALCAVLTACGQSGALYLPDAQPAPASASMPETEKEDEKQDNASPATPSVTP